jgi:hypothetical protein
MNILRSVFFSERFELLVSSFHKKQYTSACSVDKCYGDVNHGRSVSFSTQTGTQHLPVPFQTCRKWTIRMLPRQDNYLYGKVRVAAHLSFLKHHKRTSSIRPLPDMYVLARISLPSDAPRNY